MYSEYGDVLSLDNAISIEDDVMFCVTPGSHVYDNFCKVDFSLDSSVSLEAFFAH